jgi:hypothetical protein
MERSADIALPIPKAARYAPHHPLVLRSSACAEEDSLIEAMPEPLAIRARKRYPIVSYI